MPFEIFPGKQDKFYFRLKARNGETILQSEAYNAKASAKNGVQSVIKHAAVDGNFERKVAKNGQHYFSLKASNGQALGRSEMYKAKTSMENGIASVKKNATAEAAIKDLT